MSNGKFFRDDHGVICVPKEILSSTDLDKTTIGAICLILYYFDTEDNIPTETFLNRLNIDEAKLKHYFDIMRNYGYEVDIEINEE